MQHSAAVKIGKTKPLMHYMMHCMLDPLITKEEISTGDLKYPPFNILTA
jgi:hypothetical protein